MAQGVFAVIGDVGHFNPTLKGVLRRIKTNGSIRRMFVVGDLFYPSGLTDKDPRLAEFERIFGNVPCPINVLLGNHDYLGEPKLYLSADKGKPRLWQMPNYYYRLCYPNLDVIMLDTQQLEPCYTRLPKRSNVNGRLVESKVGLGRSMEQIRGEQMAWLEGALSSSKAAFKVVMGHYHLLSNGAYENNVRLTKLLVPLLAKHRVDAYICGHEHNNQHHVIREGGHKLHHLVIGSTSGCRTEYQPRQEGYISFDNCYLEMRATRDLLVFSFVNLANKKIRTVKIRKDAH